MIAERLHSSHEGNQNAKMSTQEALAIPGTELLVDDTYGHLQRARKGDGHILLIPQPSLTDSNDPLRWPALKKWMVGLLAETTFDIG